MDKYNSLLNDIFRGLKISELDIDLIRDPDTSSEILKLSQRYQELLETVIKSFNTFQKQNNEQYVSFDSILRYLEEEQKRLAYKTFYTHVQSFKTLLFNQPHVLEMDEEERSFFKLLLNGALKNLGIVDYQKLKKKKPISARHPLSIKEIKALSQKSNPRTRFFIEFILRTGCNVNQLAKLRKDAVEIKDNIVEIDIPIDNHIIRRVCVDNTFYKKILKVFGPEKKGNHIFQTRDHSQIKRSYFYREIKQAGISAGLSATLNVQKLIDTFADRLKKNKVSQTKIDNYLKYGLLFEDGAVFDKKFKDKVIEIFTFLDGMKSRIRSPQHPLRSP